MDAKIGCTVALGCVGGERGERGAGGGAVENATFATAARAERGAGDASRCRNNRATQFAGGTPHANEFASRKGEVGAISLLRRRPSRVRVCR